MSSSRHLLTWSATRPPDSTIAKLLLAAVNGSAPHVATRASFGLREHPPNGGGSFGCLGSLFDEATRGFCMQPVTPASAGGHVRPGHPNRKRRPLTGRTLVLTPG